MNNKIKISIVAILLIISGIIAVQAARQPNDYFAFMQPFHGIVTNPVDDSRIDLTYNVVYIPLTGSQTYALTVTPLTTTINVSQPAQINTLIKNDIVQYAISNGYNIKKIVMQSYNIVNP